MKLAGAVITGQSGIKCEPQSGDTGFCNSLPRAGGPGRCRCQTLVPTDRRRLCVPIPSGGTADHSPALRRLLRNPNCEDLGGKRMTKPPQQSSPQGGTIIAQGGSPGADAENEPRAPRGRHNRGAPPDFGGCHDDPAERAGMGGTRPANNYYDPFKILLTFG